MKIAKKYFYLLPCLLMALSSITKMVVTDAGQPLPLQAIPELADKVILVSLVELVCVLLILVPYSRNIGFFLICTVLGGAIAIHLISHTSIPNIPAILLALFWVGIYLNRRDTLFPMNDEETDNYAL